MRSSEEDQGEAVEHSALGEQFVESGLKHRVLIVERDASSSVALQSKLAQAGFGVTTESDSARTMAAIERDSPDLVMLDWDLPGVVAIDLIGRIRNVRGGPAPRLILLSMQSGEQQVCTGFESGADDYVVKPYSVPELVARVRAVLRSCRKERNEAQVLRFQELQVSVSEVRVLARGHAVALRTTEYRLLEFLIRNPERVFNRAQLLDRVWGRDSDAEERAVDVTIQRIRKALARYECEHYVQTVRSVGYRMSAKIEPRLEPAKKS
jgi:two-component system phosphate regulon response regulator PhoB